MFNLMTQNWWALALRGVVALLFGIATFAWPGITLAALVALFGAYALVDGIFSVFAAFRHDEDRQQPWWAYLVGGILGIGIGILTFFWPGLTAMGLLFMIAFWAIMVGFFELITAIRLRRIVPGEWLDALAGVLLIMFGIFLVIFPGVGALSVLWMIGTFAFALGILMIMLGFKMRSLRDTGGRAPQEPRMAPSH
ncbi:MAG TPA: HdeD family acid-resistance protein [Blastocatellia bacterium]|nr:HdeD family acid-resistance protein [Blastocatellia bacterium]